MRHNAMQVNNEFSIRTSDQVNAFCQPFLKDFKLTSFNYARIYGNNSLLALHSDPLFAELYLTLNTPPIAPIPLQYWQFQSFYFFAKNCYEENYINLLKKSIRLLNSDNPLYIVNQFEKYIEVAAFCSVLGDHDVINRYLNHMTDLTIFVSKFSQEMACLLDQKQENQLILPPHLTPAIPKISVYKKPNSPFDIFYSQLILKKILPIQDLRKLTIREIQCLYYLCRGYGHKAIGNQLEISSRTVETHIINAKTKLNVHSSAKLILVLSKTLV